MFENDLADLDEDDTLAAVEGNEHTAVEVEVTRLLLAAHWADLKPGDAVDPHGIPGAERAIQPGGEGTPEIADFAPAELGCSLKLSAGSAKRLIADALDLRHRLPATWASAMAGQCPTYQARYIAKTTRHLTLEQARQVDARVAQALGSGSPRSSACTATPTRSTCAAPRRSASSPNPSTPSNCCATTKTTPTRTRTASPSTGTKGWTHSSRRTKRQPTPGKPKNTSRSQPAGHRLCPRVGGG